MLLQEKSDRSLFITVTRYLVYASVLYILVLMLCAPALFPRFFGPTWQSSGQIAAILAVSYGARLIASTLSGFLLAHNALRINGAWQAIYFIITCSLYFLNPKNPMLFFLWLTFIDVFLYGVYFALIRWVIYESAPKYEV